MNQWNFFKLRRLHSNLHRMTVVVSDGKHNDSPGAGTFSQATRHFPVIWRHDAALKKKKWGMAIQTRTVWPVFFFDMYKRIEKQSKENKRKHVELQSVALQSVIYLQLLSPGLKLID